MNDSFRASGFFMQLPYTVTRCAAVAGPTVAGNYSSLALRDVNGDGRMDLVGKTSTGTSVLTGTSTGLAQPTALDVATNAFSFGDMNGDRLPELFVASSSGTMSWQLNRRFADGNAWHVDIDAAHVIGGTIPSTDRFGGTWTLPIGMRRTVDQPLGVRQLEDGRRDFTDSLRHSGVATTLPSTALAVTDTWELTGDIATRIASESGDYEVTSMLTVLGAPDLVFDFPVDVARFGAIDASHVRVFARLVSDYQRDGTASTLPRTPEGGMKLTPVSNWIEVTPDSDGDLTSGSGPRFTVAADSTAIHVATPTLGVFRAYEIP